MRPHDPSFHGRDSRKSIRYLFTINCTCGNVFETARTSLMSLIGYARVSTAEGRQWQASTCLPPSSSTGTPPGWAKRSLGEDMPACPWSPSSCHTSRPSVGPTSCSPANTDGKNAELSLTCHFALFRNRPLSMQRHPISDICLKDLLSDPTVQLDRLGIRVSVLIVNASTDQHCVR